MARRRWIVSGRVQGVGYRAFAARVGRALRLSGGAANLDDGRVLVVAEGAAHALVRLDAALGEGPRLARVDAVEAEDLPPGAPAPALDVEF
ncbi:MAG TPA: acylphosphatase [Thermoanaerobaculia bacterium]|nr:acylphosphatase [Thermoanaerobaculia bacterium]